MATQQESPQRLYMQFLALTGCFDIQPLLTPLGIRKLDCVLYKDANDPLGVGLLTLAHDPAVFTEDLRDMLCARPYQALTVKPEFSMLGRACPLDGSSSAESVIHAARNTVMNPQWRWAVWYLMRRSRQFTELPRDEQQRLLDDVEAAPQIEAGDAGRVRLECHGLNARNNDMVIGLIGGDLDQLSTMVERRRAAEEAAPPASLGPFFVGHAVWQGEARVAHGARW